MAIHNNVFSQDNDSIRGERLFLFMIIKKAVVFNGFIENIFSFRTAFL